MISADFLFGIAPGDVLRIVLWIVIAGGIGAACQWIENKWEGQ